MVKRHQSLQKAVMVSKVRKAKIKHKISDYEKATIGKKFKIKPVRQLPGLKIPGTPKQRGHKKYMPSKGGREIKPLPLPGQVFGKKPGQCWFDGCNRHCTNPVTGRMISTMKYCPRHIGQGIATWQKIEDGSMSLKELGIKHGRQGYGSPRIEHRPWYSGPRKVKLFVLGDR